MNRLNILNRITKLSRRTILNRLTADKTENTEYKKWTESTQYAIDQ